MAGFDAPPCLALVHARPPDQGHIGRPGGLAWTGSPLGAPLQYLQTD